MSSVRTRGNFASRGRARFTRYLKYTGTERLIARKRDVVLMFNRGKKRYSFPKQTEHHGADVNARVTVSEHKITMY